MLEKGSITDGVYRFPQNMTFFSTAELLEIGGIPFNCLTPRPSRTEALNYYRGIVKHFSLQLRLYTEVTSIRRLATDGFQVTDHKGTGRNCRNLILATGYYGTPNQLNIPGENLPHVSHYYTEPHHSAGLNVVIVGGGNSGIEAALELYRNGSNVTLVHREDCLKPTIKYWVLPDIENRIKAGSIKAIFNTEATEITDDSVILSSRDQTVPKSLPADFVYLLTGYTPQVGFLDQLGANYDAETLKPHLDSNLQTSVPGLFVAGSAISGRETGVIFVENGRFHPQQIFPALLRR